MKKTIHYYVITAQAMDITGNNIGEEREEKIDTLNPIFADCKNCQDVKAAFLFYWNTLEAKEHVVVKRVMRI